jgi:hypothetical protein
MLIAIRAFAKKLIRRRWYPILLPHHQVTEAGLSTLGGPPKPLPPELSAALRLCDGTRAVAEVAKWSKVSSARLLAEAEGEGPLLLWPVRRRADPRERMRSHWCGIILSPHLDDAALSMGGQMLEEGPFCVIDVFSRVSWWRFPLADDLLPFVQRTRDAEEELVMRLARSRLERWGLAEAPLRGYPLADIFTTLRLPEAVETHRVIRERVRDRAARDLQADWFLPLGIGNHIDHRIARDAALDGLREAGISARNVHFYEDLPYAAQQPGVQDFSGFLCAVMPEARLTQRPASGVSGKRNLLRAYHSQLTVNQIESVIEYARRVSPRSACERVWQFDSATLTRFGHQIPPLGALV